MEEVNDINRYYIRCVMAGFCLSLMLGYFLTVVVTVSYFCYEFNVYQVIYRQIPDEIKQAHTNRLLQLVAAIYTFLQRYEENVKTPPRRKLKVRINSE